MTINSNIYLKSLLKNFFTKNNLIFKYFKNFTNSQYNTVICLDTVGLFICHAIFIII